MMKIIVFQAALPIYLTCEIHFTHTGSAPVHRSNSLAETHGRKYAG
jgi:hypothetical protein